MSAAGIEVERSFEVRALPAELGPGTSIRQHYLALDGNVEVRVRRAEDRCWLTIKGGHGLERTEVELPIDVARFDELAVLDAGRAIEKRRHRIALAGGLVAEVDRYEGRLAGLTRVEVEFEDRSAADAFVAPSWFGDELTGRPGWSNAELAVHGPPTS